MFKSCTMPKLNGRAPKYSLHKPTGQAKVTMNGKVTYLGKYRSRESFEAYDRLVDAIPKPETRSIPPNDPPPGEPLFVGDVVLRSRQHDHRSRSGTDR